MTRESLSRFNARAAESRMEMFSTSAEFRGEVVRVLTASLSGTMDLETGGFNSSAGWNLRMPGRVQPAPKLKEKVLRVSDGKVFVITHVDPCDANDASRQYHYLQTEQP